MSPQPSQPVPVPAVTARIRAEFNEMPGLRLTVAQVRRLWALDGPVCDRALAALEREGFLCCDDHGLFMRAAAARRSA
jgi:hypothetical protein